MATDAWLDFFDLPTLPNPPFQQPTTAQIKDWYTQTSGILSPELAAFCGLPPTTEVRLEAPIYKGPLTLAQQRFIYQDL